ncbi:MAG: LacI family DNA-binding transcriptional regulator [Bacteroidales bacterium]|nr:LacI family DNA-binding transcriptional regulator [Bacteroidales bacterium]
MKKKASTIKDIAQALNLNISTVSRALNNSRKISDETKKLVQDYAEKVNYRPNAIASSLRMGRGNTIGLVVPRINRQFFSNLIYGVEEVLNSAGYNLLICQSNELLENEKQAINTLINARVDGIIISISKQTASYKHLETVINRDIPLIQTDRVADLLPTNKIVNNNFKASYIAVQHLLDSGYKRIAHISGPLAINIYKERLNGYTKAIEDSRLSDKSPIIFENIITDSEAYKLATGLISDKKMPDAFFAASDFAALGILKALKDNNIRVPDDVGIVGFANEPFTEIISPALTSFDQYSIEMGREAARILLDELENKQENRVPKQITIDPRLIVRESSIRRL